MTHAAMLGNKPNDPGQNVQVVEVAVSQHPLC